MSKALDDCEVAIVSLRQLQADMAAAKKRNEGELCNVFRSIAADCTRHADALERQAKGLRNAVRTEEESPAEEVQEPPKKKRRSIKSMVGK